MEKNKIRSLRFELSLLNRSRGFYTAEEVVKIDFSVEEGEERSRIVETTKERMERNIRIRFSFRLFPIERRYRLVGELDSGISLFGS